MYVFYKTFVYWPDGQWKEAPNDGFVYHSTADTYAWDNFLEAWVSGYGGKIIDFTPPGMPNKAYDLGDGYANKDAFNFDPPTNQCECGAHKVKDSGHSHWCPLGKEGL